MKTLLLTLALGILLLNSCTKSSSDPQPTPATTFPQLLTAGSWTVTAYTELAEDKTKMFGGITFNFSTDGKATAVQSKSNVPGGWTWGGNSYYGTPADSKTLVLTFGAATPFDRISRTWIIDESSATAIKLSGNNPAEQKYLTLSR